MADYCLNKVSFKGEDQELALQHFAEFGYDWPPFHSIILDDNAVHFESPWIPPLKDLNEIAETYDVSYDLVYQLPNERTKEKYHYNCLQDEPLSKPAHALRVLINGADGRTKLDKLENQMHEHAEKPRFNQHERKVLSYLLGKKYIALNKQRDTDRSVGR